MTLTDEQKKRIEQNRKRALEIRQQKQAEKQKPESTNTAATITATTATTAEATIYTGGFLISETEELGRKKRKTAKGDNEVVSNTSTGGIKQTSNKIRNNEEQEDEESLEDFELSASEYITKSDAQRIYCLPLGTLAVCSHTERENPHKKGWSNMKLYLRSEVRRRARKRFGGKEGLIREREKRKEKRLEKDLEESQDVFR